MPIFDAFMQTIVYSAISSGINGRTLNNDFATFAIYTLILSVTWTILWSGIGLFAVNKGLGGLITLIGFVLTIVLVFPKL